MPTRHQRIQTRSRRKSRQFHKHFAKFFSFPFALFIIIPIILVGGSMGVVATQEETNSFCASCHTQPESTYYQRQIASSVVDLATDHRSHNTKCIDCHSGPGVVGRIGAMLLGARNGIALITRTDVQPAPLTVPIGDGNCLKCHTTTETASDFNHHFHAYLPRWQAIDPTAATCVDCHSTHTTDGDPAQIYLNTQRTDNVCQRCHSALGAGG